MDIVANECRLLYMDKIDGYIRVKYLQIDVGNFFPKNTSLVTSKDFPLKRLTLENVRSLIIDHAVQLPSTLESLNLKGFKFKTETDLARLLAGLPNLVELRMKTYNPSAVPLQVIMSLKKLRYLNLELATFALQTVGNQQQLKDLTLFQCTECVFTEEFIIYFEQLFPSIRLIKLELSVSPFADVSPISIASLLKSILSSINNKVMMIYINQSHEYSCNYINQIINETGVELNCGDHNYNFLLSRKNDNSEGGLQTWIQAYAGHSSALADIKGLTEYELKFFNDAVFENDKYDACRS